ncbi:hypothetical protein EVAR_15713_1 [Eumeta japonica]|uniref:Uncharacterized protein n=1 Tax=Eumeta variegata TaxID=151549 RepID=A0A4C1U9P4_EUMVA|nr:hypothetical protein EVAR_15713_1 [Eumeta japonica]
MLTSRCVTTPVTRGKSTPISFPLSAKGGVTSKISSVPKHSFDPPADSPPAAVPETLCSTGDHILTEHGYEVAVQFESSFNPFPLHPPHPVHRPTTTSSDVLSLPKRPATYCRVALIATARAPEHAGGALKRPDDGGAGGATRTRRTGEGFFVRQSLRRPLCGYFNQADIDGSVSERSRVINNRSPAARWRGGAKSEWKRAPIRDGRGSEGRAALSDWPFASAVDFHHKFDANGNSSRISTIATVIDHGTRSNGKSYAVRGAASVAAEGPGGGDRGQQRRVIQLTAHKNSIKAAARARPAPPRRVPATN